MNDFLERQLPPVRPGDVWLVKIGDGMREVKVVASSEVIGYWLCLDSRTDVMLTLRGDRFARKCEPSTEGSGG